MNKGTIAALTLVGAVGFGLLLYVDKETLSDSDVMPAAEVERARDDQPAKADEDRAPRIQTVPFDESSGNTESSDSLFSRALMAYARTEFLKAWKQARTRSPDKDDVAAAMSSFQRQVLSIPAHVGKRQAEQRNDHETALMAVEEGDGIGLLKAISKGIYEVSLEQVQKGLVDQMVTIAATGDVVDGTDLFRDRKAFVKAGMVIEFPVGVHKLDERRLRGKRGEAFPPDVTIRGAGMDATLLRIGNISIRSDVKRLTFINLTIDCENDGLFDLRRGALLLDLERVRIVRFDAGHGGCTIFTSRTGCIIRMRHSEIIGGYGRSPGWGDLWRNTPFIARFTDCRFVLVQMNLRKLAEYPLVTTVFENCAFNLIREDPDKIVGPGVLFKDCNLEKLLDRSVNRTAHQKKLTDLFPGA